MKAVNILISHAHDEKALAEAWKDLLTSVSLGAIQVWFSSDVNSSGGIGVGSQWREQLYQKLNESNYVIAIQTPASANRPWIMWECGVASGIEGERGLIPVVFSMGRGDLSNPLTTYQVYQGEDKNQVREICSRLVNTTELTFSETIFEAAFTAYEGATRLHRPRRIIQGEQMILWKTRFEELVQMGRYGEVAAKRGAMYASFGQPFRPIEPSLHDLLSKILLDQKQYQEAIEEIDYALSLVGGDVDLLHRKALALVQMQNLPDAEAIIQELFTEYPG